MFKGLDRIEVLLACASILIAVGCGDGDSNGTAQDVDHPPQCIETCDTPDDCVEDSLTSIIFDADNYDCDQGYCVYLGCLSDAECAEMAEDYGGGYGCYQAAVAFPQCVKYCTAPADCVQGTGLYTEENYDCVNGYCDWKGCVSDEECHEIYDESYTCMESAASSDLHMCVADCDNVSDCIWYGFSSMDEDNFQCVADECVYLGCYSDEECQGDLGSNWACVDLD